MGDGGQQLVIERLEDCASGLHDGQGGGALVETGGQIAQLVEHPEILEQDKVVQIDTHLGWAKGREAAKLSE